MKNLLPFRKKITSVFITGAAVLLLFYTLVVESIVHYTENLNSEQRIHLIAPFHLKLFDNSEQEQVVTIDPLITIYSHFALLPSYVREEIDASWIGSLSFIAHNGNDKESEYTLFAQKNKINRIVYAVEHTTQVEWNDTEFLIVEIALFAFGLLLFAITAIFITNMAKRIASPFTYLATQLHQETDEELSPIAVKGELSEELVHTVDGINHFRTRIKLALSREQSFTRYISHELRTPMTVIKGSLSILRRQESPAVLKQIQRIDKALNDMESLTKTFLLLARDTDISNIITVIDTDFIHQINHDIECRVRSNNVAYSYHISAILTLKSEPILINSLLCNLLFNAINCSVDGRVHLQVDEDQISVIDNGVGLNKKARGYDGFGIGLNLVKDICQKYDWKFSLANNIDQGCIAIVKFARSDN